MAEDGIVLPPIGEESKGEEKRGAEVGVCIPPRSGEPHKGEEKRTDGEWNCLRHLSAGGVPGDGGVPSDPFNSVTNRRVFHSGWEGHTNFQEFSRSTSTFSSSPTVMISFPVVRCTLALSPLCCTSSPWNLSQMSSEGQHPNKSTRAREGNLERRSTI